MFFNAARQINSVLAAWRRWETAYCLILTSDTAQIWLLFSVNLTLSLFCRNLSFSVSCRRASAHYWLISGSLCAWRNFSPTIHRRGWCFFTQLVFFPRLMLETVTNHRFLIWNSFINWPRVIDTRSSRLCLRQHATRITLWELSKDLFAYIPLECP